MKRTNHDGLLQALTNLIQVITLMLLIHLVQEGFAFIVRILVILFRLNQPIGVL